MDALASAADEGRGHATKRLGELRASIDPRESEWGNPARVIPRHGWAESIGSVEVSGGTETSQYPEEKRTFPE